MVRRFLLRSFQAVYRFSQRLRRRCTPAGLLVLGGLVAAGVFGIDTQRTLAFQIFALLLSVLGLSIAMTLTFRSRLRIHRLLPEYGTVDQPLNYRVIVENLGKHAQTSLSLIEELETRMPHYDEFIHSPEPSSERRNWFDRYVGYPRWLALLQRNRGAAIRPTELGVIPPRDSIKTQVELTPARRGYLQFARSIIARPDPFGLINAFHTTENPQSLLVLPKRYPTPPIHLPGKRTYQHGGVSLAASVADSQEFTSLRDYRPGDPLRRIHWRSYAKQGELIVKEYQDEFFIRYGLVLDTFLQDASDEIFEEAVSVAASFACSSREQDSLLDLLFAGPDAYVFTAGRGLANTDNILEVLACVEASRDKPFSTLQDLVFRRASQMSAFICVLINWDLERQEFIRQLTLANSPLLVVLIVQPGDTQALDPGPLRSALDRFCVLEAGKIEQGLLRLDTIGIQ